MKDQIDTLIDQATMVEDTYPPGCDGHPVKVQYFDKRKFAELIINDCLDLIKSKTGGEYHIGMSVETRRAWTIWFLLKEHFGVQ